MTRTYKVKVSILNPAADAQLGMTAGVDIRQRLNSEVASLPLSDVFSSRISPSCGAGCTGWRIPPVGYPIQLRVLGEARERARAIAAEVVQVVRADPHASNVHFDWNELAKVVRLNIGQDKARVLGISSQELSLVPNAILSGYNITYYRERNRLKVAGSCR